MIGSLIGGVMGMMGANSAASSAEAAAQQQREANQLARTDLSSWREAGRAGIDQVIQLMGLGRLSASPQGDTVDPTNWKADQAGAMSRFQTDPDYQFRQSEGEKGINRSLAAKTGVLNGAAVKEGTRFNQDLAKSAYGDYYNRMMAIATGGQQAATTTATAGVAGAQAAGNDMITAGKARQSGYDALGKGISSGINNAAGFGAYQGWW